MFAKVINGSDLGVALVILPLFHTESAAWQEEGAFALDDLFLGKWSRGPSLVDLGFFVSYGFGVKSMEQIVTRGSLDLLDDRLTDKPCLFHQPNRVSTLDDVCFIPGFEYSSNVHVTHNGNPWLIKSAAFMSG